MKEIYLSLVTGSVLLPLIVGLVRFHRLGKTWQPFFWMIVCMALTVGISRLTLRTEGPDPISNNIKALVEWVLIAIQFNKWGLLRTRRGLFYGVVSLVVLIWATEDLILGGITIYHPYFAVLYSFLIVLFSIRKINFMITYNDQNPFRDPVFLGCIGFIILFSYSMMYTWAYQKRLHKASDLADTITMLYSYVNVLVNLIFTVALLSLPLPQRFSLRKAPAFKP